MHRSLLFGVAAGAPAVVVFAAIHHLLNSNIWVSLLLMLIAGALCGAWRLAAVLILGYTAGFRLLRRKAIPPSAVGP